MKPLPLFLLCSSLALVSHASAQKPEISLQKAFPNLVLPDCPSTLAVTPGPGGREVVGLQRGLITVLPTDRNAAKPEVFLDFRERLKEETDFEEGLHGMVFHPDFAKNRRFFLSYSQRGPRRTVISEMCALPGPDLKADPRTERILMEIPHPLGFHWGGGMVFDPEGFLVIAVGDGGLRDDAYSLAQNPWDLHGKVLRLDVNTRTGSLPYGIPADNPFTSKQEVRPEIWALGFRNPWGLSFDAPTKTLWLADVGQDLWEEVNIVTKGGNYGWGEREGPVRMVSRLNFPEKEGPFTEPLHAYSHKDGLSITGGMVYRGSRIPALQGQYLFGDWGHGKVWSLRRNATTGQSEGVTLLFARDGDEPRFNPTVIGADAAGEILIFSHYPGDILTLTPNPVLATDETAPEAPETDETPVATPEDVVTPEIQENAEEHSSGA